MKSKFGFFLLLLPLALPVKALTLAQAEMRAIAYAPEIKQYQANSDAFDAKANAALSLPEPTLHLGALNLPVDSFNLSQEPMTQLQAGISQTLPKGHSLISRANNLHQLARASHKQSLLKQLQLIKQVRLLWFQMLKAERSERILKAQYKLFSHLKQVTASLLANNKVAQKDLLNAELQLNQIDEQLLKVKQDKLQAQASLSRWLGKVTNYELGKINQLPKLLQASQLKKRLLYHPIIAIGDAAIAAADAEVDLAQQNYKPQFSAGVAYGYRQGQNPNNRKRPDFLSGTVSISLPLWVKTRNDNELNSAIARLSVQKQQRLVEYHRLQQQLNLSLVNYQKLNQRIRLYRNSLLPVANQLAQSTLLAYQNNQTDFNSVAQSYVQRLNLKLALLAQQIAANNEQINLLYLQGFTYEK